MRTRVRLPPPPLRKPEPRENGSGFCAIRSTRTGGGRRTRSRRRAATDASEVRADEQGRQSEGRAVLPRSRLRTARRAAAGHSRRLHSGSPSHERMARASVRSGPRGRAAGGGHAADVAQRRMPARFEPTSRGGSPKAGQHTEEPTEDRPEGGRRSLPPPPLRKPEPRENGSGFCAIRSTRTGGGRRTRSRRRAATDAREVRADEQGRPSEGRSAYRGAD